jgi:hypothetical protein
MQFSYLAVFFLLLIILLAFLLLAPFSLLLNVGKKGPLIEGSIRLSWLGLTLRKAEMYPQSGGDLLASVWKEDAEKEVRVVEKRKAKKDGISEGNDKVIYSETTESIRPLGATSLIKAAPAMAKIIRYLLKSIHINQSSCRLCFGLDDPAQTAIISGYLWFLTSALGIFPARILIEPCFAGERLEGELVADIEARPLWPVFAVILALREREIRLLLREMLGRA